MGDLKEWIRVYRRAPSTATPSPQEATPSPTQGATVPAPPSAGPDNPLGTVLPTIASLRDTGIPLAVFAVFGTLLAILVREFYRRTRRPQRR